MIDPFDIFGPRGQRPDRAEAGARERCGREITESFDCRRGDLVVMELDTGERWRARLTASVRPAGYAHAGQLVLALDQLGADDDPDRDWSRVDYALVADAEDLARLLDSSHVRASHGGQPVSFTELLSAFHAAMAARVAAG